MTVKENEETPQEMKTQENITKKSKEYEVQWSMKWVNFQTTVQATSEEDAIAVATKSYEDNGLKEFTVKARNEEVSSLEDIFKECWHVEANRTDDSYDEDEEEDLDNQMEEALPED
jgi:hypothetical protein